MTSVKEIFEKSEGLAVILKDADTSKETFPAFIVQQFSRDLL